MAIHVKPHTHHSQPGSVTLFSGLSIPGAPTGYQDHRPDHVASGSRVGPILDEVSLVFQSTRTSVACFLERFEQIRDLPTDQELCEARRLIGSYFLAGIPPGIRCPSSAHCPAP